MPRKRRTAARNTSPLFILVAIITVVVALYVGRPILLPFALAVLLTFLLAPVAGRLELWGLPRVPAVIVVVAMSFAVLGGLGWVVTEQVVTLGREMSVYRDDIVAKVREVTQAVQLFGSEPATDEPEQAARQPAPEADPPAAHQPPDETETAAARRSGQPAESAERAANDDAVEVKVVEMPLSPVTQIREWLGPLVGPVAAAGIVVVLVFFMLLDRENQRDRLIQLFGATNLRTTTEALQDAARRVGRYLRMMFLMNAGYGVAVIIGLWLLGVPGAVMWGVLGFALRFIPYLGPWMAAAMPVLVSIAVADGWMQPLLVAAMYLVYETLLNNVAEPLLYGNSIGVSTVGVILAAIFWTWIWGPVGLIVAMPMTVCLVVLARHVPELRFITVLLGDQPPLSPAERVYQRLLAFDYNEPLKIARNYLKADTLLSLYDEVLIPALSLAEQDRHAGFLNEHQETFVQESAEDLVEELGQMVFAGQVSGPTERPPAEPGNSTDGDAPPLRTLCIPLRDVADEIAVEMLAQLLAAEGFAIETGAADSLTSELVDRVGAEKIDIVIISALPPVRPRDSRLLWKRLRQRYPKLPIIVGYWTGAAEASPPAPPEKDAASKVAASLAEALQLTRNAAAQIRLARGSQASVRV